VISQIKKAFFRWVNSEGSPNSLLLAMALGVASFGILLSFLAFQNPVFEPGPGKPMVAEIELYGGASELVGETGSNSARTGLNSGQADTAVAGQAVVTPDQVKAVAKPTAKAPSDTTTTKLQSEINAEAVAAINTEAVGAQARPLSLESKPANPQAPTKAVNKDSKPAAPNKTLVKSPARVKAEPAPVARKASSPSATPKAVLATPKTLLKPAALEVKVPKPIPVAKTVSKMAQPARTVKPVVKVSKPVVTKITPPGVKAPKDKPVGPSQMLGQVQSPADVDKPIPKATPVQVGTVELSTQPARATAASTNITFSMPSNQQAGSPGLIKVEQPISLEPLAVQSTLKPDQQCTRIRQIGQAGEAQATVIENLAVGNDNCMYP
jgi:hypothetical protein